MIKNFGIDLGNGFTKYDGGIFASRVDVRAGVGLSGFKGTNTHEVSFDGQTYTVGKGQQFISPERFKEQNYAICLLTAIALSNKGKAPARGKAVEIEANVVLGLPISVFGRYKTEMAGYLKETLKDNNMIVVDAIVYNIKVNDVKIFVEGALPLVRGMIEHVVTIDIGAGTINVQGWDNKELVEKATQPTGFTNLCAKLGTAIQEQYGVPAEERDILKAFEVGTMNTTDGKINVKPLIEEVLDSEIGDFLSRYQGMFKMAIADSILVFGGGASVLVRYIQKRFPKAQLVEGNQFVNQKIYTALAKEMFK